MLVRGMNIQYGHMTERPPSTASSCPVMKLESGEAKKAMALATSSTFPGRPSGCVSAERFM